MKISKLLIAVLIASATLVSAAHATTISNDLGTVGVTSPLTSGSSSFSSKSLNDTTTGKLKGDTEITFTLTSSSTAPTALLAQGSLNGSAPVGSFGNPIASSTGSISSVLPIIATSNLTTGTATITIANFTTGISSFAATFLAAITKSDKFTVSYIVSAVPLPATWVLFASALIALAGFRMKKARNQA